MVHVEGLATPHEAVPTGFEALMRPRCVAVAGVSSSGNGPGARYVRTLLHYGFPGNIYVIHPTAETVEGLPAVATFADLPEPVDYAFVATPADAAIRLIEEANGMVRFAQVMASGFGEESGTGPEGSTRAGQLIAAADVGGVRVIGPNCLGTHSPRGRLSFVRGASTQGGTVGVICQSGGLGVDIITRGDQRGIGFSGLVTMGNCLDVSVAELLQFYTKDAETSVIGLYLESVRDGRKFFEALGTACSVKPVVILKGGRTSEGSRAAASHTGALSSDDRVWRGLCAQVGAVLVETLDQLLDALLLLQNTSVAELTSSVRDVALFGNGGGTSVLASDALARADFALAELSEGTIENLVSLDLPPGTGLRNPVDTPAGAMSRHDGKLVGEILASLAADQSVQALIMHVNLAVLLTNSDRPEAVLDNMLGAVENFVLDRCEASPFLLVLRSDGSKDVDAARRSAIASIADKKVSVYPEIVPAIHALRVLRLIQEAR